MNTLKTLTAAAALMLAAGAAQAECVKTPTNSYVCTTSAKPTPQRHTITLANGITLDLDAAKLHQNTRPHFYGPNDLIPGGIPVAPIVSDDGFGSLSRIATMQAQNRAFIDCKFQVNCQPFDAQRYFENLLEAASATDQDKKNCFFRVLSAKVNGQKWYYNSQILATCKVPAAMETDALIYIEALQLAGVR
jgi:hypothetical protein